MSYTHFSDKELIERYQEGCVACFEVLLERYKSKVYSYIMMLAKDKQLAEDLFQDTFVKIIRTIKADLYHDEGKFIQFAMRIAHNLIIDHFRKAKKLPIVDSVSEDYNVIDNLRISDPSKEQQMIREQVYADLRKMIDYLPSEQREVLFLRMYQDMSFKDIAEVTNVSINTALGRMRYALINMRKMMKENDLTVMV